MARLIRATMGWLWWARTAARSLDPQAGLHLIEVLDLPQQPARRFG
jgi:hypothetical protein